MTKQSTGRPDFRSLAYQFIGSHSEEKWGVTWEALTALLEDAWDKGFAAGLSVGASNADLISTLIRLTHPSPTALAWYRLPDGTVRSGLPSLKDLLSPDHRVPQGTALFLNRDGSEAGRIEGLGLSCEDDPQAEAEIDAAPNDLDLHDPNK